MAITDALKSIASWFFSHLYAFIWAGCIILAILLVSFLIKKFFHRLSVHFGQHKDLRLRHLTWQAILASLVLPSKIFIWIFGLSFVIDVFADTVGELPLAMSALRQIAFILLFAWAVIRSVGMLDELTREAVKGGRIKVDPSHVEMMSKFLTVVVIVIAILSSLDVFGVDLRALLAIGGLGTLAVGLAGKDVFANFFSGFVLHFTRPFQIGEHIVSPDRPIEGVVEHIGWYMTRILTLDKKPTYIPNSIFSTVTISNFARMPNRRIKEVLGFRYRDLERLTDMLEAIREMLRTHPEIDKRQKIYVHFLGYGEFQLKVLVQAVTRTPTYGDWLRVQEDVLLKVGKIAHAFGIDFAFPTTTLDLPGERPSLDLPGEKWGAIKSGRG